MFSNMKRLNLFMLAAIVAVSSVFVSCNKEDEPKASPSVTFTYNGDEAESGDSFSAKVGDEATIVATFVAPGEIASIEFKVGSDDLSPTEFDSATGHEISKTLKFTSAGSVTISAKVTDKQDPALVSPPFSITITVEENELEEEVSFLFEYFGQGNANNKNPDIGMIWFSVTGDPLQAIFRASPDASTIVELTQQQFTAINSKEKLAKAYDDGTKVREFILNPPTSTAKHFITKKGDDLFLAQLTAIRLSPHQADIKYKK